MTIGKLKRLSLWTGFVAVSMSLVGQPAVAFFNHGGSGTKTLWVNCDYRTIGNALKRHRTKALVIIVKGTCYEDVVIDRNRVTLVAVTPQVDGITSQAADGAAVTVSGAQSIVIGGLRLQSAGGGFPAGLFVTRNGEATMQNAPPLFAFSAPCANAGSARRALARVSLRERTTHLVSQSRS